MAANVTLSPAAGRVANGAALATLYVLGMLNYWLPVVRFTSPLANALFFVLLQFVPFSLLVFNPLARVRRLRALAYVFLILVSAFAGLLGIGATFHTATIVATGQDASFERLEVRALSAGHLAIYRTNGGAMTSFGISIRQECSLLPGLLRVRNVWGAYPAREIKIQALGPHQFRISSPPHSWRAGEIVEMVGLDPLWCPGAA